MSEIRVLVSVIRVLVSDEGTGARQGHTSQIRVQVSDEGTGVR